VFFFFSIGGHFYHFILFIIYLSIINLAPLFRCVCISRPGRFFGLVHILHAWRARLDYTLATFIFSYFSLHYNDNLSNILNHHSCKSSCVGSTNIVANRARRVKVNLSSTPSLRLDSFDIIFLKPPQVLIEIELN
jgi:hypothetical protein